MEPLRSNTFESVCEGTSHIVGNRRLREPQEQAYLALREHFRKSNEKQIASEQGGVTRRPNATGLPIEECIRWSSQSPHFADSLAAGS